MCGSAAAAARSSSLLAAPPLPLPLLLLLPLPPLLLLLPPFSPLAPPPSGSRNVLYVLFELSTSRARNPGTCASIAARTRLLAPSAPISRSY